jgi:hypothetical protein
MVRRRRYNKEMGLPKSAEEKGAALLKQLCNARRQQS